MTKYSALLRQISELEARVGQKDCEHLVIIVNEGEDPKPAQAKALAEWMAAHPKAKKRDVGDFSWIVWTVVHRPPPRPDTPLPSPPPSRPDVFGEADEKARKRFGARRLVYSPLGWS
jgi:hypothetical protein